MTTIQPSAPTVWGSTLRDMAANLTHDAGCFHGQKPDMDCDKCRLEGALLELEMQAETIQRYKEAGAISALEVMPSNPAIQRLARRLYSESIGSLSTRHHAEQMRAYDERTRQAHPLNAFWLARATDYLRCAAGLK